MAGTNPLIQQGTLNRLLASVVWTNFPGLNVTASYLDKEGIKLALEGVSSLQHGTMTGIVQSPEPYLPISVTINLLKTQQLANAYKTQMESISLIGAGMVYPDVNQNGNALTQAGGLGAYQLQNMSIQSTPEIDFSGTTPVYRVTLTGYYIINNALWGGF
jgi:hypothetical protein